MTSGSLGNDYPEGGEREWRDDHGDRVRFVTEVDATIARLHGDLSNGYPKESNQFTTDGESGQYSTNPLPAGCDFTMQEDGYNAFIYTKDEPTP